MIDTSGEGLHKRGYRAQATAAPIKETLAAAMAYAARIYPDSVMYEIILPSLIQEAGKIKKCALAV